MSNLIYEIHKDMITGKIEVKEILINIERDSVCLGDDITAPHLIQIFFSKSNRLSDLFKEIIDYKYIPKNSESIWNICYQDRVLGQICFHIDKKETYQLFVSDEPIAYFNNAKIYCKRVSNK